ncbi:hypothetical protein PEX1_085430 [Penicillium expansum]|uniref:Uncharacterized protein n=1 Tax=Penicillium expansum TaxID=27334 RepID=A0A0A2JYD5_PENEN|nr:hypothetical protein PEX2_086840 [Penicillium expansum]KGO47929.1 hypothetical protein PEXP_038040 [Penicillium expansum]KGO52661.1 hypothetical protein PEX1_085430 [Penicillium expansum]KGO60502.1 hypothetical protein PEX2_086840 [Penicillium expansum]
MCLNLATNNHQQLAEDQSNIPAQVMTLAPKCLYHILTGFTRACNCVAHRRTKIRTPANCRESISACLHLEDFPGVSGLFFSS